MRAIEVITENKRIAFVCSRCRQNRKYGNFTLSFFAEGNTEVF